MCTWTDTRLKIKWLSTFFRNPRKTETCLMCVGYKRNCRITTFSNKFIDQGDFIVIHQCFKELGYYYAQTGETIINYGDIGETFFIIIRGAVDVYVPYETNVSISYLEFIKLIHEYKDMILEVGGDKKFIVPPIPNSAIDLYNKIKLDQILMKLDGFPHDSRRTSTFFKVWVCIILLYIA